MSHSSDTQQDPVLAALLRIENRLARLEQLEKQEAPAFVGMAVDTLDGIVTRLHEKGIDLDDRLRTVLSVAERLTSPTALAAVQLLLDRIEDIHRMLDSGLLDARTLQTMGALGRALAQTSDHMASGRVEPVGMWGAFKAMGDPNVQQALGFLLHVAGQMGQTLPNSPTHTPKRLT